MPKNIIKGPITPEERIEEQERKDKGARKEREAVADFQEEEKALENADGCEVSQTATGKVITRHNTHKPNRSRRRRLKSAFTEGGLFGTIDEFSRQLLGLATTVLTAGGVAGSKISGQYNTQVDPHTLVQPKYETEEYIYDTVKVSKDAHEKLMKESEIINAKVAELQTVKDAKLRTVLAQEVEKLADEYDMRPHPFTGLFVHDLNRVLEEEKACNLHNHLKEFQVCYYALKAEHGDVRGIKAKIADQFDQDPSEVQASGDHLKGAAPAPHLH